MWQGVIRCNEGHRDSGMDIWWVSVCHDCAGGQGFEPWTTRGQAFSLNTHTHTHSSSTGSKHGKVHTATTVGVTSLKCCRCRFGMQPHPISSCPRPAALSSTQGMSVGTSVGTPAPCMLRTCCKQHKQPPVQVHIVLCLPSVVHHQVLRPVGGIPELIHQRLVGVLVLERGGDDLRMLRVECAMSSCALVPLTCCARGLAGYAWWASTRGDASHTERSRAIPHHLPPTPSLLPLGHILTNRRTHRISLSTLEPCPPPSPHVSSNRRTLPGPRPKMKPKGPDGVIRPKMQPDQIPH